MDIETCKDNTDNNKVYTDMPEGICLAYCGTQYPMSEYP